MTGKMVETASAKFLGSIHINNSKFPPLLRDKKCIHFASKDLLTMSCGRKRTRDLARAFQHCVEPSGCGNLTCCNMAGKGGQRWLQHLQPLKPSVLCETNGVSGHPKFREMYFGVMERVGTTVWGRANTERQHRGPWSLWAICLKLSPLVFRTVAGQAGPSSLSLW